MANILLLDSSEVAAKAMQGILGRGHHRLAVTTTSAAAWKALHDLVKIDAIFMELELKGERGGDFLARLRKDSFLKSIPVVIYTNVSDQAMVRKVLAFGTQNYLIKPYTDDDIFREIAKAMANPWRNLQFEEEKSYCAQVGCSLDDLRGLREELMDALEKSRTFFATCAAGGNPLEVHAQIDTLSDRAELCGVWGVVDYMKELKQKTDKGEWGFFDRCDEDLTYARQLIALHLNPHQLVAADMSPEDLEAQREADARAVWMKKDVDKNGPVFNADEVLPQVEALPACPVIDSVAAAFQMTVENSHADNLKQINDLVSRDPGLVAQVLISANHLDRDDDAVIDDLRTAVSLLGNVKLSAMAKTLPTVPERHVQAPPITWPNMWLFQVAVGHVAHYTAKYLEFEVVDAHAQTAGLLHDIGKLVLLKLFPFAFPAIVNYSRERNVPMHAAERKFLGCSSREMGEWFARKNGLPTPYCNVIRWVEDPAQATEDIELVGVVSLARHLCLHNHVGFCGDTPKDAVSLIEESAAWHILRPRVFPSFQLHKFSIQVHAFCMELKQSLGGHHAL